MLPLPSPRLPFDRNMCASSMEEALLGCFFENCERFFDGEFLGEVDVDFEIHEASVAYDRSGGGRWRPPRW